MPSKLLLAGFRSRIPFLGIKTQHAPKNYAKRVKGLGFRCKGKYQPPSRPFRGCPAQWRAAAGQCC